MPTLRRTHPLPIRTRMEFVGGSIRLKFQHAVTYRRHLDRAIGNACESMDRIIRDYSGESATRRR